MAANPNPVGRTGIVTIASQLYTVRQNPLVCLFSLSPTLRSHGYVTSTNTFDVVANGAGCDWTLTNNNSWITITPPTNGQGNRTLTYTVAANPNTFSRTGLVRVADQVFTVTQDSAPCTNTIFPTLRTPGSGATNDTVAVMAATGCAWSTVNTNPWISILAGTNGTGTGVVSYAVAANPNPEGRTGVVTIASQAFTVRQSPLVCLFSLSPILRSHGYGEATNTFDVVANGAGCAWTLTNSNSWITITPPTNGLGNRTLTYTVTANPNAFSRTGLVKVADQVLTMVQDPAPCTTAISPTLRTHGPGAATDTVEVTATVGCAWTTSNSIPWVSILSGASGTGTGTVSYAVAANPNPVARTGLVIIASQVLTIRQSPVSCLISLSPVLRPHGYGAATNTFDVVANGAGCSWTLTNNNSWITITSPTNGLGNQTVGYTVAANPNSSSRTGLVSVANQVFTLTQDPAPCTIDLTPIDRDHGYGAATNTVDLATAGGCPWNVVNTNGWIVLISPASGSSSATVTYRVTANTSFSNRMGVVRIGGQPFTVTQQGLPCNFSVSPTNRNHGYGTASNFFGVTAGTGCGWTVIKTNNWITFATSATGNGNGTVGYLVTANPSSISRTAVLVVEDAVFTLTQDGAPCTYSVSPGSRTHGHGATTNMFDLTTPAGCPWSVFHTNNWITILSATNGTGNTTVLYSVAANPYSTDRTALLLAGGKPFNLTQRGASCTLSISPTNRMHGYGGATNTVSLMAGIDCPWGVTNTNNWITIMSPTNGTGTVNVAYAVAANLGLDGRTGSVLIGGLAFVVNQAGFNCAYDLSPSNRTHGAGGSVGTASVTANTNCAWSVGNTNTWIMITSGQSGMGDGSFTYTVAANTNSGARTGYLTVSDQTLALTQRAMSTGLDIESITMLGGGSAKLRFSGDPLGVWRVEASSNLVNWVSIGSITNVAGGVEYTDANAVSFGHRFYRAATP